MGHTIRNTEGKVLETRMENKKKLEEIAAELRKVALEALSLACYGRLNERWSSMDQSYAGKGGLKAQLFRMNLIGCLDEAGWSIVSSNGGSPSIRAIKYGIEAGIESKWPYGNMNLGDVKRLMRECKPKPRIILLLTYRRLSGEAYRAFKNWSRSRNILASVFYLLN
jgi:hypothetical protein